MTIDSHRTEPRANAADSGFSLIEVVVAIALLLIVTTSALYFVSKARYTSTDQQATQIAAALASSAMEQVYAVPTKPVSSGVINLYTGRSRTDVTAAFAANSSIAGVSSTFPVWDPAASTTSVTAACPTPTLASIPTSGPLIPVTCTNTSNGTIYTVTTLIGACYRAASYATGAAQDCTAPSTVPTPNPVPAASTTSLIQLTRVIVIVAWNATTSCALAGGCTYSTAALFNTDTDLTWASN